MPGAVTADPESLSRCVAASLKFHDYLEKLLSFVQSSAATDRTKAFAYFQRGWRQLQSVVEKHRGVGAGGEEPFCLRNTRTGTELPPLPLDRAVAKAVDKRIFPYEYLLFMSGPEQSCVNQNDHFGDRSKFSAEEWRVLEECREFVREELEQRVAAVFPEDDEDDDEF